MAVATIENTTFGMSIFDEDATQGCNGTSCQCCGCGECTDYCNACWPHELGEFAGSSWEDRGMSLTHENASEMVW